MSASFFIDPASLFQALVSPAPPVLIDVRRREVVEATGFVLPASRLADHGDGERLARDLERDRAIVVACAHGHNRSQRVTAHLRAEGYSAACLAGGSCAWTAAGLPVVRREVAGVLLGERATCWTTRRRPTIDPVACAWLVARFLDPRAQFLFVEPDQVLAVAEQQGGVAYASPGAPFEHNGDFCTFDMLLNAFGLDADPHLAALAAIVRGADRDRFGSAPQSAGLRAVTLGLSARFQDDDHAVLRHGFSLFDGLYAWLRDVREERHGRPRGASSATAAGERS